MLSFFLSFSQKIQKSVGCNKDLKAENQMVLLPPAVYGTREYENMSNITSRNDFIMQNYYVKKQKTIFTVQITIKRKQRKHGISFLSKILKSCVIICDTMAFTDNSKVDSIRLS
jgi:hypothetical protein